MAIRRLVLQNYRSFKERHEIELAPVTVILGKNNSGKSALTRLPLVLDTGFGTDSTAPLDLDRLGPDAVDDIRELYFDQLTVHPMTLGVALDGEPAFQVEAQLTYEDAIRGAVVSRLLMAQGGATTELTATRYSGAAVTETPDIDGIAVSTPSDPLDRYEIWDGAVPRYDTVRFAGLLPDLAEFRGLRLGPIRYLGPYRERVARQHRLPIGTPAGLGVRGEGLAGLLAHDRSHGDGKLLVLVNDQLAAIAPGWKIEEVPAGPLWSTVLTRRGSRVQVNLADAGSGLAQVLPILMQCALDALHSRAGQAPLQIIEEPEMHLHPAAHAELADLYLRTARATGTQFLIETHSETLLLRLRRRIAEVGNDFGPETVAVYVVKQLDGESTVRRVEIDELGNLADSWPDGYFSQDYKEVRALARAQSERSDDAS